MARLIQLSRARAEGIRGCWPNQSDTTNSTSSGPCVLVALSTRWTVGKTSWVPSSPGSFISSYYYRRVWQPAKEEGGQAALKLESNPRPTYRPTDV